MVVSRLFGTQSLQQDVMKRHKLVEKYAASFGLPDLRATYPGFAGATLANEGLMAGTIHMAGGTVPGAIALWDRTDSGVKAAMALNASNPRLLTTNPAVKTVADLTDADRIAMPTVGISPHAIYLQMAAVKALGPSAWSKFDKLTLARAHPESVKSLLVKKDISCHFSASP